MIFSFLIFSAPVLFVIADALLPVSLLSASLSPSSLSPHTLFTDLSNFDFRYSLVDIPLISIIRSAVIFYPQLSNKLSLKSNEQQHSDEEAHLVGEEGPFLSEASSPLPSPTGGPAKRLLPCRGSSQPSLSKSFVTRSTTSLEEQDRSVRMPKEETGVEEQDRRSLLNDELDQIHESVGSLPMSSMLPMLLMSPMPEGI
ncbi:hypothetical protein LINPERPRIM_LOCUS29654, partial [Linum perenne]